MTREERQELTDKARTLINADTEVNGWPVNAPYTIVDAKSGTRYKVRVAEVKNEDKSTQIRDGRAVYRFWIERPVEIVTSDQV